MAFPANPYADMSQFVPAGPNGIPIPRSFAPTFGIEEPIAPIVPPEPIVVPPPPPTAPLQPGPPPTPTAPNAAALFQKGAESVRPAPLNDNTVDPFAAPVAPATAAPKAKAKPTTATGMQLESLDQRADVARQAGDVKAEAASEESKIRDQQIIDEDRATKERDAARKQEQAEIAKSSAGQQAAFDQYVNHKVDQNRAWHNKSTGGKIMAGIGVALAGIGQAFSARAGRDVGPSNPALDIITKAIDDDVRQQMADRDKLRDVAGMKRDATNELIAQYKDNESQYDALRAAGRERVSQQLLASAAKFNSPLQKLAAEETAAGLQGQRGEILATAQQREEEARARRAQLGLAYKADKRADEQFTYQKEKDAADTQRAGRCGSEGAGRARQGRRPARHQRPGHRSTPVAARGAQAGQGGRKAGGGRREDARPGDCRGAAVQCRRSAR
jgi:hypothetical protein